MKFTKMHGLGNDYVYVNGFDTPVENPSALSRVISDRHTGVGSDGLILIEPSDQADVRMVMFNADGSRSQMCGNGIRCVAKYAVDHGLAKGLDLRIETDCGVQIAQCTMQDGLVAQVRVDMGSAVLDAASIPTTIPVDRVIDHDFCVGDDEYKITCVSMGNPHVVIFEKELQRIALHQIGPLLENAPEFPQRINVHFVRIDGPDRVTMRTWERGSGATRACGSGACAVCVAGVLTKRTERAITVSLPGGDLQVEWASNDHVYMTGPAVEVFTGDWPS